MNTKKIKEIGKWMMVAGGTIFTSCAGCYFVGNYIERKDEKHIHQVKMDRIDEEEQIKSLKLRKTELMLSSLKTWTRKHLRNFTPTEYP